MGELAYDVNAEHAFGDKCAVGYVVPLDVNAIVRVEFLCQVGESDAEMACPCAVISPTGHGEHVYGLPGKHNAFYLNRCSRHRIVDCVNYVCTRRNFNNATIAPTLGSHPRRPSPRWRG